jgi:hypothetical protein
MMSGFRIDPTVQVNLNEGFHGDTKNIALIVLEIVNECGEVVYTETGAARSGLSASACVRLTR